VGRTAGADLRGRGICEPGGGQPAERGRVAGTDHGGLPEYEALAVELATNPPRLAQIRQKLLANRLAAPLFDTPRFARQIEAAYVEMHERWLAGRAPDHIYPSST